MALTLSNSIVEAYTRTKVAIPVLYFYIGNMLPF